MQCLCPEAVKEADSLRLALKELLPAPAHATSSSLPAMMKSHGFLCLVVTAASSASAAEFDRAGTSRNQTAVDLHRPIAVVARGPASIYQSSDNPINWAAFPVFYGAG